MAVMWTLVVLSAGLFCLEQDLVSGNEAVEEMRVKLTSIESSQNSMRDSLRSMATNFDQDFANVTNFCENMEAVLDEHMEVIYHLRQVIQDGKECQNESLPDADNSGPCNAQSHTVLDDDWRAIAGEYHGYDDKCDNRIQPGWYRFRLHGQNARIPTSCVPENHCQTDAPTWLDLQGQSLPGVGQEVDARACSHWDDDCCNWEAPITVRNCGHFFVYKVQPLVTCDLAFCAEPHD